MTCRPRIWPLPTTSTRRCRCRSRRSCRRRCSRRTAPPQPRFGAGAGWPILGQLHQAYLLYDVATARSYQFSMVPCFLPPALPPPQAQCCSVPASRTRLTRWKQRKTSPTRRPPYLQKARYGPSDAAHAPAGSWSAARLRPGSTSYRAQPCVLEKAAGACPRAGEKQVMLISLQARASWPPVLQKSVRFAFAVGPPQIFPHLIQLEGIYLTTTWAPCNANRKIARGKQCF